MLTGVVINSVLVMSVGAGVGFNVCLGGGVAIKTGAPAERDNRRAAMPCQSKRKEGGV